MERLFLFSSLADEEIETSRGEGIGPRPPWLALLLLAAVVLFWLRISHICTLISSHETTAVTLPFPKEEVEKELAQM